MKYFKNLFFTILTPITMYAQVGINTNNPHLQTDLHLASKNKALILNHVDDYLQLDDPQEGMIIYDTKSKCFKGYADQKWTTCFGQFTQQQQTLPIVNVNGPGFTGSYITNQQLTNQTFEVHLTNNSFNSVKINFYKEDLILNSTSITVSGVKYKSSIDATTLNNIPENGIEINSGAKIILVYNLTGKPIKSGKLTGNWKKLSLEFEANTEIIYQLDCSKGYWYEPISPSIVSGLVNGVTYNGIYRIPFVNAEEQIFSAEILRQDGIIIKRAETVGNQNGYIDYNIRGTYTGENGKILTFNTLENCQIILGETPKNCKEILTINPNSKSGEYYIDIDGTNTNFQRTKAYCDMETDGGGWTLILNYNHRAAIKSSLDIKTNTFPLQGSTELGNINEESTQYWGHVSNDILSKFDFNSIRFYGKSAGHNRIIHFRTELNSFINFIKTRNGLLTGVNNNFTALNGHTAIHLPKNGNLSHSNKDYPLNYHTFYIAKTAHWNIGFDDGTRWEVDDFITTLNDQPATLHQVWVR